jgi:glycosyltransferase involved in cell wall biosynthesis
MPRRDVYRALHEEGAAPPPHSGRHDSPDRSYRSGFWCIAPLEMASGGAVRLALGVSLSGGESVELPLAEVVAAPDRGPDPEILERVREADAVVAIAMATYEPDIELFRAQVQSIRDQTERRWVCVISDDCSSPGRLRDMLEVIGGDRRFVLRRGSRRRGFYGNFERALRLVPDEVTHVALADQDDRWHPDKIATLLDALGDHSLVYSDQRIVNQDGDVLAPSYWQGRSNNYRNLASLLIANTVTGAASLFRRDLLARALPFPQPPGEQYHDHWLALVALASGGIGYVDRPLYDYVQHGGAALGHAAASSRAMRIPELARGLLRGRVGEAAAGSRAGYFYGLCRIQLIARVLLMRCGATLDRRNRRVLRRILRADRSPATMAWLALRPLRDRAGRDETLGAEHLLLRGIVWRYAVQVLALGRSRPPHRLPHDASLPRRTAPQSAIGIGHRAVRPLAERLEPLQVSMSEHAPRRVNLLVPTIELKHLFGGYIAKFNLARKLAEQGLRTRIVAVDPTPALPLDWRRSVEAYAGLEGLFGQVEVAFAREDAPLELNPDDGLIATTWWTAHLAGRVMDGLNSERFLYLIQEYEPYTFPAGSWAAIAKATYDQPHFALFSTEFLRAFFARRGYGVFSDGELAGDRDSRSFQNAITSVDPPTVSELRARKERRLLFYARPEAHAFRNMFEFGLMALAEAGARGRFWERWRLLGIGAVSEQDAIRLPPGAQLELLARRDQADYAELLRSGDVGLSLMFTPHPSLVPLEMASAGMVTVTNSFENKTAEAMEAIAGNLIVAEPSLEGIVAGLEQAVRRAEDFEARVAGADVRWSRDWDQSLDSRLMEWIVQSLTCR